MKRFLFSLVCALHLTSHVAAQDLTALARVDPAASRIEDGWWGRTEIVLALSQGVPFRVFTLDAPARLVVDFREVDFSTARAADLLGEEGSRISGLRFGAFQPGWSRLVADMAEPMLPQQIGMPVDPNSGRATLEISLKTVGAEEFAEQSGAPEDPNWTPAFLKAPAPKRKADDRFTVVLDPGHGGIDPGAEREDTTEKQLMLGFARTLADALRRSGVDVVLTRDDDYFVALETRVAIAHQVEGDLFISLHADVLSQGGAKGATVYTLSDAASDAATEHLAARHDRSDIIAGADLTGSDDQVAQVLLDLARQETEPRSRALAKMLAQGMAKAGGPMNRKPLREAGFSVLKSADIPSVLIEIGFLSSKRDLANISDPIWRKGMAEGIAQAVLDWRDEDAARAALVRQ
ncbi:N-acetylmuramoyl-L-alanine amidase [Sulfitobacter sp. F26169L]|uniref:N-acetylmuramoyl-L-alanine amidase n=1 Tax=Sulfitobacter sp. F26169L TaxID=2996015 RepID=UPI002260FD08|nr:N-acetylmuramoyl-L-alanine amidase [Sulfitobacter sp. F26169L]MCX7565265.1 N-acetylmuramoyl-L-alanine amidase [Sulfitobacter sp. F26169L]